MAQWSQYYDRHADRDPRPLLGEALGAVLSTTAWPRQAIDLGCGQGTETLALLAQGWRVLAVDREPEASTRLASRVDPSWADRLEVRIASFGETEFPASDLIWSALSLPFCSQEEFTDVWARIRAALVPGGVVAVDLWGVRHGWAASSTTVEGRDVEEMLLGLEVLRLEEQEEMRPVVAGGEENWHSYVVVARRRPDDQGRAPR